MPTNFCQPSSSPGKEPSGPRASITPRGNRFAAGQHNLLRFKPGNRGIQAELVGPQSRLYQGVKVRCANRVVGHGKFAFAPGEVNPVARPVDRCQRRDQIARGIGHVAVKERPGVIAAKAGPGFDQQQRYIGPTFRQTQRGKRAGQPAPHNHHRQFLRHGRVCSGFAAPGLATPSGSACRLPLARYVAYPEGMRRFLARFTPLAALIMLAGANPGLAESPATASLAVTVTGIKNGKGVIRLALCPPDAGFPDCKTKVVRTASLTISGGTASTTLTGLAPGRYAVSVFHDANSNGKLDTFAGIPKEGYGFSRNPGFKPRAPKFAEAEVQVDGASSATIKLRYIL